MLGAASGSRASEAASQYKPFAVEEQVAVI